MKKKKEIQTKKLIWCGICERETGKQRILGEEIDEDVRILTVGKSFTLVRGSYFAIICPIHNEVIFTRNEL